MHIKCLARHSFEVSKKTYRIVVGVLIAIVKTWNPRHKSFSVCSLLLSEFHKKSTKRMKPNMSAIVLWCQQRWPSGTLIARSKLKLTPCRSWRSGIRIPRADRLNKIFVALKALAFVFETTALNRHASLLVASIKPVRGQRQKKFLIFNSLRELAGKRIFNFLWKTFCRKWIRKFLHLAVLRFFNAILSGKQSKATENYRGWINWDYKAFWEQLAKISNSDLNAFKCIQCPDAD